MCNTDKCTLVQERGERGEWLEDFSHAHENLSSTYEREKARG